MDARDNLLASESPPPGPVAASRVPRERADAQRNRAQLLEVARRIVDSEGVDALTMDRLAREAHLGKGTIFRRFGSRSGLLLQLLNEIETEFQRGFLAGPPPLGPGAEPIIRLVAFGRQRLELLSLQGDLLRAAEERPDDRYSSPARGAGLMHVSMLLRQAGFDGDVPVFALNLISMLDATLVLYENRTQNIEMTRLADGWEQLVLCITAACASPARADED
ncbi:TetR/AcrR family transcriptional regulator [Subtercola frigoramans]|uniref:AcrR family transcriptional regulator n=1 Tax=Subtercola frigoramans TaxID=120298 RepID=A0ABS2L023_9MICO|nr:TetR/AcrR family transcriptional regulator [Subtercola frigoramans]MBM7470425.1 AcrR family transcriptional regulator [Subtercola frigoramans]